MSTHELPQLHTKSNWRQFGKACALGAILAVSVATSAQAVPLVIETNGLSIAGTGTYDLKDNAMIWRNGSLTTINAYLSTGLNLAGAPPGNPANAWWDGYQLQSSVAAQDGGAGNGTLLHGLGGLKNELDATVGGGPLLTDFFGRSVGITDILVLYTCMGDADFDGFITPTDQFLLDNAVFNNLSGWINGDFDYDGFITPTDQFLLDNSVIQGCVPPPAVGAAAAVPEPSAVGLLLAGLIGFVGRRGKRNDRN